MTSEELVRVRLDKWLWAARFYKTRALAATAIETGKVEVNGERAKRAKQLQVGDQLHIRLGPYHHVVTVRALSEHRGPSRVALGLHEKEEPLAPARERLRTSWDEILASEVIRRLGGLGDDPALSRQRKNLRYVRRLHETVFRLDSPEPVWEARYFDSFGDWNFGHL